MAEEGAGTGILGFIKEHPMIVVGMVFVIALLLLKGGGSGQTVIAQPGVDPNAGAEATQIALAQIQAGSQNLQTVTNLFGTQQQIAAQADVANHQIDAQQEVTDNQTQAGITINATNTAAALEAAKVSAGTSLQIAQANAATTQAANQQQFNLGVDALQTQKDIARAQDNTQIVNGVISGVTKIFEPWTWF